MPHEAHLEIISTCPESHQVAPADYTEQLLEAARWCDEAGHEGLLIHSDHRLLDPWVVAQLVLQSTSRLRPVVTVQPLYAHPYAVAKKIVSLANLFGRCPDINLVAGGIKADLLSFDDSGDHDLRYRRLTEYGSIVQRLLDETEPLVHTGEFYRLYKPTTLRLADPSLRPRFFVAGSSAAGRQTAAALGARTVGHIGIDTPETDCLRLGIIARDDERSAWAAAKNRFHSDPAGRLRHRLDMCWSDSSWQRDLASLSDDIEPAAPVWLGPFESRRAQCAYLVGDHRTLAREIVTMLDAGTRAFILDTPASRSDIEHADCVFRRAWSRFASPLALTG